MHLISPMVPSSAPPPPITFAAVPMCKGNGPAACIFLTTLCTLRFLLHRRCKPLPFHSLFAPEGMPLWCTQKKRSETVVRFSLLRTNVSLHDTLYASLNLLCTPTASHLHRRCILCGCKKDASPDESETYTTEGRRRR